MLKRNDRTLVYKNSTNTVRYCLASGSGYSYETQIAKLIDGVVYIDSHYFSRTTSKHRTQIKAVLNSLDQPYVEVDAGGEINKYNPTPSLFT